MDGLRDQERNTPQQRKEDGDSKSTRKPPSHVNPRSVAKSDNMAHTAEFAEKINLISAQGRAEDPCGPSTQLMGVDLTHNFDSECAEKGTKGFFGNKPGTIAQRNSDECTFGDNAMCPYLDTTEEGNRHKAMHVD